MADVRTPKDRAAEATALGRLDEAVELHREVLRNDPDDLATRQKLGEALRRAGRTREAVAAYRSVADRLARDGLLVKAIAISKAILELDPGHVETQAALAELYAKRAASGRARPEAVPGGARGAAATTPFGRIALAAADAVAAGVEVDVAVELDGEDGAAATPIPTSSSTPTSTPTDPTSVRLPRVPIFSDLTREGFLALTRATGLRRIDAGEVVISEGETGASFYVVATGRLAVSRRDERGAAVLLGRLGEGDFFGEMALLSGAPRAATVVAEAPSELLELPAEALVEVARVHPHLAASLRRFYRQRLLANAMAMSPIFRPFPEDERRRVVERFRPRALREGERVIREGDPAAALYVVLDGALDVVKRKGPAEVAVGQLRPGDVFGEISCLRKVPATASVVARRAGSLLELPRSAFDDLVVTYPQILELVADLSEERSESLDAILTGHAQWTEDGLVLL